MQHSRREILIPTARPVITSRKDLTPKNVSLVGSDSVIGSCIQQLAPHKLSFHPSHTLDFDKPKKTVQTIRKGNPDCYIIGYSILDTSSKLIEIARIVIEAAKYNDAQIIGFTDYNIYSESELQKTENSPIEQTAANPQLLYERILNQYKLPLIFRIGKLFGSKVDFIRRYLNTLQYESSLQISDTEYSLTSFSLLQQGLALGIAWRYIETYNLCESGVVTDIEIVELLKQYLKQDRYAEIKMVSGGNANYVLENSLWQTFSMTEVNDWTTSLKQYLLNIK